VTDDGFVMPPEWGPHERTLMGWPCRRELWRGELTTAKAQYAAVANAVAAFEPVTMACPTPEDAAEARAALDGRCEVLEVPLDDSWLRDCGPIYVTDGAGGRRAVHFRFNAWGEKFATYDKDAAVGALLARHTGDDVTEAPIVLEGGAIAVDGEGTLVTTEQCLLHPNRNPGRGREELGAALREHLGVRRVVWLGRGLAGDRDTDGHVDMLTMFTPSGELLLQSAPPGHPDHEPMLENRERAEAAGLRVRDFPIVTEVEVAGARHTLGHLNAYVGARFAIVPVAGGPTDEEVLARFREAFGGHEVVGVQADVIAFGGGGPHCITQQVPARGGAA
jgi:agmatine deiminase